MKYIVVSMLTGILALYFLSRINMYKNISTNFVTSKLIEVQKSGKLVVFEEYNPKRISINVHEDSIYHIMLFRQCSNIDTAYYIIIDNMTSQRPERYLEKNLNIFDFVQAKTKYVASRVNTVDRVNLLKEDRNIQVIPLTILSEIKLDVNRNLFIFFSFIFAFSILYIFSTWLRP